MKLSQDWFIYALGSGWGHLNRALSLARVATQTRSVHLLTNSVYARLLIPNLDIPGLKVHLLPSSLSLVEASQWVHSLLLCSEYGCLIVDTFPRGLIGELAEFLVQRRDICRVLVHRDLSSDYIKAKALDSFVSANYDGILIPGEKPVPFIHLPQSKVTLPWLSRSKTNLLCEPLAHWCISKREPLIIVCATGQPQELDFFGQLTSDLATALPNLTVRCLAATCPVTCSPDLWFYHWPGMDVLQFADVVVSGGGYNLVHECAALDVPLIAFSFSRLYDRQAKRIRQYGCLVKSVEEVITAVHLITRHKRMRKKADYTNGVAKAIAHIEAWNRAKQSVQ